MSFESLFMVNGVTVNENLRGQALTPVHRGRDPGNHGRDRRHLRRVRPVQRRRRQRRSRSRAATCSAARSATRSTTTTGARYVTGHDGGTPFTGDRTQTVPTPALPAARVPTDRRHVAKVDQVVPTYEYTFGGPDAEGSPVVLHRRPLQDQQVVEPADVRHEHPVHADERPEAVRSQADRYSLNCEPPFRRRLHQESPAGSAEWQPARHLMDLASLYNAQQPAGSAHVQLQRRAVAQALRRGPRHGADTSTSSAAARRSPISINGTLLRRSQQARHHVRYWSPTFCGVCEPENRDNDDLFLKATYFKSTQGRGSHNITFGYDTFNDKRRVRQPSVGQRLPHPRDHDRRSAATDDLPAVPQTATRCCSTTRLPTPAWARTSGPLAVLQRQLAREQPPDGQPRRPLGQEPRREQRWAVDANDSASAPNRDRSGIRRGDGDWSVTASFAKYIAAISNSIADSSSSAGNTAAYTWAYAGPPINANANAANLVDFTRRHSAGLRLVQGRRDGVLHHRSAIRRLSAGVSVTIPNGLSSPNALEYAVGIGRQISGRIAVRADYLPRFSRLLLSADRYDDRNRRRLARQPGGQGDGREHQQPQAPLSGLTVSSTYRVSAQDRRRRQLHAVAAVGQLRRRERRQRPRRRDGLSVSGVHARPPGTSPRATCRPTSATARACGSTTACRRSMALTLSVLQTIASGVPYGAVGRSNVARPFVTNPGYVTPRDRAAPRTTTSHLATRTGPRPRNGRTCRHRTSSPSSPRARVTSICSCRPSSSTSFNSSSCAAAAARPCSSTAAPCR